jgi:hypothetical protein
LGVEEPKAKIAKDVRISCLGGVQLADVRSPEFYAGGKAVYDRKGDPNPLRKLTNTGTIGEQGFLLSETPPPVKITEILPRWEGVEDPDPAYPSPENSGEVQLFSEE